MGLSIGLNLDASYCQRSCVSLYLSASAASELALNAGAFGFKSVLHN